MDEMYKKITELIKKHDSVFIMAHKNIDLDALGSSLCLSRIVANLNKKCYILMSAEKEVDNTSIIKALEELKKNNIDGMFINMETIESYVNDNSLLFILDTHKRSMVEYPSLLDNNLDIVVIDHHIKGEDSIENGIYSYINANLSSMNEIMVGYLKYLNIKVEPVIATIMLAGIEIDTNAFNTKTTTLTYEAAALLARMGANNIIKQELLQEKKEAYIKRAKLIYNSFKVKNNFEICVLDDKIYERRDLALISEELLKFENVEASFTIGRTDKYKIGISARSLGRVNVEVYMSLLGGGGHATDAAVQIISTDILEVKEYLLNVIEGGK